MPHAVGEVFPAEILRDHKTIYLKEIKAQAMEPKALKSLMFNLFILAMLLIAAVVLTHEITMRYYCAAQQNRHDRGTAVGPGENHTVS